MKPITNILLVLALVFYAFLPVKEISISGNATGLDITSMLLTYSNEILDTIHALFPFIIIFLAIGINCLKNRWWSILAAILIFFAAFFFVNLRFQGLPLIHEPEVAPDAGNFEGMPVRSFKSGFYLSATFTILALISALISLMPFKFNKRLEERLDKRFESSKKHIGKMGHSIHGEFQKLGKKSKDHDSQSTNDSIAPPLPEQQQPSSHDMGNDESRFMPEEMSEDEKYKDYMPK